MQHIAKRGFRTLQSATTILDLSCLPPTPWHDLVDRPLTHAHTVSQPAPIWFTNSGQEVPDGSTAGPPVPSSLTHIYKWELGERFHMLLECPALLPASQQHSSDMRSLGRYSYEPVRWYSDPKDTPAITRTTEASLG
jgi:hypothetical protein